MLGTWLHQVWGTKENKKLIYKNKCYFRFTRVPLFDEVILRCEVYIHLCKLCTVTEMPPKLIKKNLINFRHNELPRKIITINIRDMWTTKKTSINEDWMNMEKHVPELVQKGRIYHPKRWICGIPPWKRTVSRKRCSGCWSWSRSSASEG